MRTNQKKDVVDCGHDGGAPPKKRKEKKEKRKKYCSSAFSYPFLFFHLCCRSSSASCASCPLILLPFCLLFSCSFSTSPGLFPSLVGEASGGVVTLFERGAHMC